MKKLFVIFVLIISAINTSAKTYYYLTKYSSKSDWKKLERKNALNLMDFHARIYDPLLGRFISPDPLREKFPWISSYAYALNNPVNYTDPTGMKVTIASGLEDKEIKSIFDNLQILTDNKLSQQRNKDGSINIGIQTVSNGNSKKPVGTSLIKTLINLRHNVIIDYKNKNGYFNKKDASIGNFARPKIQPYSENGKGSDSFITFDLNFTPYILSEDPISRKSIMQKTPSHIGLGHELIHSYHYMKGKARTKNNKMHNYKYINELGKTITGTTYIEEIHTIGLYYVDDIFTENKLRIEHKLGIRVKY